MPATLGLVALAAQPLMLSITHYLFLSVALLLVGFVGALTRRNLLIRLFSIELILTAVTVNLAAFARLFADTAGQGFAFFVTVIMAAQILVLLAILTAAFRPCQDLTAVDPQEPPPAKTDAAIGKRSQLPS
jgi:NADH-quinone oxidoreductase subunit K